MAQKIDFISIRVTAFLIINAWTIYFTDSLLIGLIVGIVLFIGFNVLYNFYEKKKRPYSYSQLAFYLAINDNSIDLVSKLIPLDVNYIKDNNTIITKTGELIYVSFGFSPFGMSDTIKAVKAAKAHNSNMLTIVTSEIDRRIFTIISRTSIPVNIINIKHLMRMLLKKDLIPDIKNQPKKIGTIGEIFNRQAAGRFLLCGGLIALMSIVMPIKLYYLLVSLTCFILGIICMINPKKHTVNNSIIK